MGWYQDNFPGSAAAKQRSFLAKSVVVYSVVVGGLLYAYYPLFRRIRKDVDDGTGLFHADHQRDPLMKFINPALGPSGDAFLEIERFKERHNRQDVGGPDVSEERIRMIVSKPHGKD